MADAYDKGKPYSKGAKTKKGKQGYQPYEKKGGKDVLDLADVLGAANVAELLSQTKLQEISDEVVYGVRIDEHSREDWMKITDLAMDIAKQTAAKKKTFPFEGASNVRFPLIPEAVYEYGSRTLAEVIRGNRISKSDIIGKDPSGQKYLKAQRFDTYINYNLMYEQTAWVPVVDKSLHMLPMTGTVLRKVYYDELLDKICVDLCNYKDVIINHGIHNLEEAPRITHRIRKSKGYLISRMRAGLYCDIDLECLSNRPSYMVNGQLSTQMDIPDDKAPYTLLEQHCFLDLDGDDYPEPYVVILHELSGHILRIVPLFGADDIELSQDNEVLQITPERYFTDWHCLPNPDGGFWSLGFGQILYPINEVVNSIINNMIDAATLNNQQSGFMTRQVRLKGGDYAVKLGEWKFVDIMAGSTLKDNLYPIPTREPSPALFQLLGLMLNAAKDLTSVTDVLKGQGETQNVAATTVSILEKQGLTLYTAMQKRLFQGLKSELGMIAKLVKKYVTPDKYQKVLGERIDVVQMPNGKKIPADFLEDMIDVMPVFDPSAASDTQRMMKLQQIMMLVPDVVNRNVLGQEAAKIMQLAIPGLINPPPDPKAPPGPEQQVQLKQVEVLESQIALNLADLQHKQQEAQLLPVKAAEIQSKVDESKARSQKMAADAENAKNKILVQGHNIKIDAQATQSKLELDALGKMNDASKIAAQENADERRAEIERQKIDAIRVKTVAPKPSNPSR